MISMIWLSQTALRFAETDLFTTMLCGLLLMFLFLSFKIDEEGTTNLYHLIAGFLYIFTSSLIWNRNPRSPAEKKAKNRKKENKKKKGISPPVIVDKKKNRKGKRNPRKMFFQENREPKVLQPQTKVHKSWETCSRLNRCEKSIYDSLSSFKLNTDDLRRNNYPSEGFRPRTLVENSKRICLRCTEEFEVYNGLYLSPTKCHYHPKRATFDCSSVKMFHACCNLPEGAPPCTMSNHHVTLQHRPRKLVKSTSKRHVKKDQQNRILGFDCEMCYTTDGLEVTRLGLVDINGNTVYQTYVKPKNKILDYNTEFSGVEKKHLEHEKMTTDNVKQILQSMLHEDTILVGHALNNDLASLGFIHNTIVDTSVMYVDEAFPMKKKSLKHLAAKHLGLTIQDKSTGHDCVEDARVSLQLALLKVPPETFTGNSIPRPTRPQFQLRNSSNVFEPELPLRELQNTNEQYSFSRPFVYNTMNPLFVQSTHYGYNSLYA